MQRLAEPQPGGPREAGKLLRERRRQSVRRVLPQQARHRPQAVVLGPIVHPRPHQVKQDVRLRLERPQMRRRVRRQRPQRLQPVRRRPPGGAVVHDDRQHRRRVPGGNQSLATQRVKLPGGVLAHAFGHVRIVAGLKLGGHHHVGGAAAGQRRAAQLDAEQGVAAAAAEIRRHRVADAEAAHRAGVDVRPQRGGGHAQRVRAHVGDVEQELERFVVPHRHAATLGNGTALENRQSARSRMRHRPPSCAISAHRRMRGGARGAGHHTAEV